MVRHLFLFLFSVLISTGFLGFACGGGTTPADAPAIVAPSGSSSEPLPATADSAEVEFRDLNAWTENDLFCIATLVDNKAPSWKRIWVRIELLDSVDQVLTIDGKPDMVVRALADAIPPRGASAFFVAIPFSRVSGVPVSCRLSGAGATPQPVGPILIPGDFGGVRIQKPDPKDSTQVVEIAFQAQASIENPLDMVAKHLRVVLLLYGNDGKLYFVQMLNPEDPKQLIKLDIDGPINPHEKRKMACPISYAMLPKQLQELRINRVEVQGYDALE